MITFPNLPNNSLMSLSIYLTANYDDLLTFWVLYHVTIQGRIQDFELGGVHLKKIAPSGGRRENFWGFPWEKSRFYAKKS